MKPSVPTLLAALLLTSCQSARETWQGDVRHWGTLRAALRDGETEARVNVADVARPGVYAVGALEDLRGEITIDGGEVWITEGDERAPRTRFTHDAPATVLFAAEVDRWEEVAVEDDVAPSAFEAFVLRAADEAGLDTSRPFPFVVEGGLRDLRLHVIAGECPLHARGGEMDSPPFALSAAALDGRLVGIYASDSTGVVCHHGSQVHVHALVERSEGALTGHVEAVGLAAGATLLLPLQ